MYARTSLSRVLTCVLVSGMVMHCGDDNSEGTVQDNAPSTYTPEILAKSKFCGKAISEPEADPTAEKEIPLEQIETPLTKDGVEGWIHGAVPRFGYYVFTYRDPGNFFKYRHFSMISKDPAVLEKMAGLFRHDYVKIKGAILRNSSPFLHIAVTDIELLKKYQNAPEKHYRHNEEEYANIAKKSELLGVVHAIIPSGEALVLDYKGLLLPMMVSKNHQSVAARLFRGDKIHVRMHAMVKEGRPAHLMTNPQDKDAITVIDRMTDCHQHRATMRGGLVYFPLSPQLKYPVYALREEDENGLIRNWTLINFTDIKIFEGIITKMDGAWDVSLVEENQDRNKWIATGVTIEATGMQHIVSPHQANPQIMLDRLEDLKIIKKQ